MHNSKKERLKNLLPANVINQWQPQIVAAEKPAANVIEILDFIGHDYWFGSGVTAQRIANQLRAAGESADIVVNINSPGGEIEEGIAIFELLRQHKGHVEVRILSMAASIASVIALAGDSVKMSQHGLFMIHDGWTGGWGNSGYFEELAAKLDKTSNRIAGVYAERTGMSKEQAREMMIGEGKHADGTYMSGDEALEHGFIDAFLEPAAVKKETAKNQNHAKAAQRILQDSGLSRREAQDMINAIRGTRDAASSGRANDAAPSGTHNAAAMIAEKQALQNLALAVASLNLTLNR